MPVDFIIKSAISLTPVLIFLVVLLHLDSFKLVRFHIVIKTMLAGCALAMVAYAANGYALEILKLGFESYSRYVAPVIEECLKATAIFYLFRTNRIGFPIDAIILGFAVGTGFGLFENMYYLQIAGGDNIGVWIMRGFGAAIMHGGATAIFASVSQALSGNERSPTLVKCTPGLAAAIILHSFYNHFPDQPLLSAVPVLFVLPLTFVFVFKKSEHALHRWLVMDFSSHEHLIELIEGGEFANTEGGRFVLGLADRLHQSIFPEAVSYLRLHTELVLQAESILLAQEAHTETEVGKEIQEKFKRLHKLERTIGKTTLAAMRPHLHFTRLELWELYQLEGRSRDVAPHSVVWIEHIVVSRMHI